MDLFMADIPLLLLAAGGSERLGHPKQLLPWGSHTLIEFQIQKLMKTRCPVMVVLGAHYREILPLIQSMPVKIIVNHRWKEGMGSSIRIGIAEIEKHFPEAEGVLVSLVDQPLIPWYHYNQLIKRFQMSESAIVASESAEGWRGVPAVFDRKYFEKLRNLNSDKGAKEIIRESGENISAIVCAEIADDIDTPEFYRQILDKHKNFS